MTIHIIGVGFLIALCVTAVIVGATPARSPVIPPKEQAAVAISEDASLFAALLAAKFPTRGRAVVIVKDTVSDLAYMLAPPYARQADLQSVPLSLRKAFITLNKKAHVLPEFKAEIPLLFARAETIREMYRSVSSKRFHERFPSAAGYISFSLPAYSPDRSTALVFVSPSRDFGGGGTIFYMKKVQKRWGIIRGVGGWRE